MQKGFSSARQLYADTVSAEKRLKKKIIKNNETLKFSKVSFIFEIFQSLVYLLLICAYFDN